MKTDTLPLADKELALVREPVTRAHTLPPSCYKSQDWYDKEINAIFMREWICVGRVEQVAQPGDYFTMDVVGEPIVVVRTEKNEIKVHLNTCRHRGAAVAEGQGNAQSFRCPYHSWLYGLDGTLKATPGREKPMDDPIENFFKKDWSLCSVRSGTWGGFIFICFDKKTSPLSEWLGDMPELLKNYQLDKMVRTYSVKMDVRANWKAQVENFLEGYHITTVHSKHLSGDTPQKWTVVESAGPYLGNHLENSVAKVGKFPVIEGLTEAEKNRVSHFWLVPNVKLSVASTYMKYFLIMPNGVDKHILTANWCFPEKTTTRPDFEEIAGPNYYGRGTIKWQNGEWVDEIVVEDNVALEKVQHGLSSRFATSGRFANSESLVHAVANFILDRVEGIERDGPSGPKIPPRLDVKSTERIRVA